MARELAEVLDKVGSTAARTHKGKFVAAGVVGRGPAVPCMEGQGPAVLAQVVGVVPKVAVLAAEVEARAVVGEAADVGAESHGPCASPRNQPGTHRGDLECYTTRT